MGPTWGPPGSCRPQMSPKLAPWTLLPGSVFRDVMESSLVIGMHISWLSGGSLRFEEIVLLRFGFRRISSTLMEFSLTTFLRSTIIFKYVVYDFSTCLFYFGVVLWDIFLGFLFAVTESIELSLFACFVFSLLSLLEFALIIALYGFLLTVSICFGLEPDWYLFVMFLKCLIVVFSLTSISFWICILRVFWSWGACIHIRVHAIILLFLPFLSRISWIRLLLLHLLVTLLTFLWLFCSVDCFYIMYSIEMPPLLFGHNVIR